MSDEPKMPKPPPLVSVHHVRATILRAEAAGFREIASKLLTAEMAADWSKVAAVRAELVAVSLDLEAEASQ